MRAVVVADAGDEAGVVALGDLHVDCLALVPHPSQGTLG